MAYGRYSFLYHLWESSGWILGYDSVYHIKGYQVPQSEFQLPQKHQIGSRISDCRQLCDQLCDSGF